jgi:hypothetical protein
MKQFIKLSMLVSALMLNVSHPLFAAQPPKPGATGWKIERVGEPSIVLPISKQEIEQEIEKAAGESQPNVTFKAEELRGILLPTGSIIVCGILSGVSRKPAFVMKFATDARGVYQIDRSFGSSISASAESNLRTWRKNGVIFHKPPQGYAVDVGGYVGACLANKGAKPDEFLFVPGPVRNPCWGGPKRGTLENVQVLMSESRTGWALMNDRGDIIKSFSF